MNEFYLLTCNKYCFVDFIGIFIKKYSVLYLITKNLFLTQNNLIIFYVYGVCLKYNIMNIDKHK